MLNQSTFTVYNASAGSGKTFTLVKAYLKILLQSNNLFLFKNILAITFTNKAVAEMKARIIDTLKAFSNPTIITEPDSMFSTICGELEIEPNQLHDKSKKLLHTIIHNYAAFNITTIDGFTHKLIRTFAYDLKLPLNFEVELDQDTLLNEAVNSLIAKAGSDDALTKTLVDFAIEKADDDKSWDITYDFNAIGKHLFNENDTPFVKALTDKSLSDFKALKQLLISRIKSLQEDLVQKANSVLTLINEAGLEFNDFLGGSRAYLPNYFLKLKQLNLDIDYTRAWVVNLEDKPLYPEKSTPDDIKIILDQIKPEIVSVFNNTKDHVFKLKFLNAFYKNITPLSVLNAIDKELEVLKTEQNKLLISEFNSIISNEIKNQPTPFIYERIGEKLKHYFIDEFQDTSKMQWDNLVPLLDNTLSSEGGSAMIVGDAKQAIYRWRGGVAEQFIDLFNKTETPFQIQQTVNNLESNYRSLKEIVAFNNGFFKFLSNNTFSKTDYAYLYHNAHQNPQKEAEGYVELSFLNIDKDNDKDELYANQVLLTIKKCLENGNQLKDICILTRYKKDEKSLASYLSAQNGIKVISEDGLLLSSSPEVSFINNVLALLTQPNDSTIKVSVLNYLATLFNIEDKHNFFSKHINCSLSELFRSFENYNIHIVHNDLLQLPLYELVETIVRAFSLVKQSNAFVQFYLDLVLEFSNKNGSDILAFLEYFEKKKDTLSIVSPKEEHAIQLMTIHKAKGLEFPVVIFPYTDLDIYSERDPKEWFPLNSEAYHGFKHALINFNKDFEHYGDTGKAIFNNHKAAQELDNINLLYVALTRAAEQLYIISKNDSALKDEAKSKKFSGMFIHYLEHLNLWNSSQSTYSFGQPETNTKSKDIDILSKPSFEFISTNKKDHNIKVVTKSGFLWDTQQAEAIEKGNLIHQIMAQIQTKADVNFVIDNNLSQGVFDSQQATLLKAQVLSIVEHPELSPYFDANLTIYTEQDIVTHQNVVLRPDRIIINQDQEAVIIDYKTGVEDQKHKQQLQLYEDVLLAMQYTVKKRLLVYINHNISIQDV